MKAERLPLPLNPHIEALPPYNAGMNLAVAREKSGRDDIAGLASNENADGCSPAVLRALTGFDPSRYSDPNCTELKAALAHKLAITPERVVVGNGSEEMIAALCRAALRPGARVGTVVPGFGLHEIEALAAGATVEKVAMGPGLVFDVPAIVTLLQTKPALFFLASPSNPVGPALDRAGLAAIIAAVAPETLFVLDEAYVEFRDADTPDGLAMLAGTDIAWAVLRTFSKAYGLAGLRVGYAVTSDLRLARVLSAAKTPFNVNAAAQRAAIAALEDEAWMRASVNRVRHARQKLADEISALGLFVAPSETNFLFIDTGSDSLGVQEHLLSSGIVVKPWRERSFETFIRVTVGTDDQNARFAGALREFVTG
ncbi:histidinol-phosphate aminotransferase [Rhizobium sp. RU20A]|uniref:histidinol-phosphate transaminase n=1 Tax=Rhizobium sp. RU20A TaxID=1907412 RepID=UPI000953D2DF|nr:histidinol-phosphate transaminase [Rhizobium sp. RU20A]SIQ94979.1 histidinol-phosphate aminotransferase [Rhizobium sp. RU20A]